MGSFFTVDLAIYWPSGITAPLADFTGPFAHVAVFDKQLAISSIESAKCCILAGLGTILYGFFEYIGIYMGVGACGSAFLNRWGK